MYVRTHVGFRRQAGDITLGRVSGGRESKSLTHAGNGHDSAAKGPGGC